MKAIVYTRVSTEEQAEKGFSIAAQRDKGIEKAKQLGCSDILEFNDEGVTGQILERPGLLTAFARMRLGDIKYFICYDYTRFSRKAAIAGAIVDTIKKYNVELVFINTSYEDSPEGKLFFTIMSAFSEYEYEKIRLRSLLGKTQKAKKGLLTHSPGLYGYDFDKETDILTPNPNESRIVRKMYRWLIDEGMGPYLIAERLNEMGVPSKKNKLWNKTTVRRILRNTAYKGTLYIQRYNTFGVKFNKYKSDEDKVKRTEKPKEEWLPVDIIPIVDEKTWDEAHKILENAKRAYKSRSKSEYLLSTIMRCGLCGNTIHGNLSTNRYNKKYKYYVCTARSPGIKGLVCDLGYIKADEIESIVWNKIKEWILNPDELESEIKKGISAKDIENKEELLAESIKEKDKLQIEKIRIMNLFQKGYIDENELDEKIASLLSKDNRLYDLIESLKREISSIKLNTESLNTIKEISLKVADVIDNLNFEEKQNIIRTLIKEIYVYNDVLLIKARIPNELEEGELAITLSKNGIKDG